jgi:hypothetical protein
VNFFQDKLYSVYNSEKEGLDFQTLADKLKFWDEGFFVLIKCYPSNWDPTEPNNEIPREERLTGITRNSRLGANHEICNVFGAYCSVNPKDNFNFFGDENCFLFSLYPSYQLLRAKKGHSKNFVFFQSRKFDFARLGSENLNKLVNKTGLGFGGMTPDNCRLWLGPNLTTGSYVNNDNIDETYEGGPLVVDSTAGQIPLNIKSVEIWGNSCSKGYMEYEDRIKEHARLKVIEEVLLDQRGQTDDPDAVEKSRMSHTKPLNRGTLGGRQTFNADGPTEGHFHTGKYLSNLTG